MQKGHLLEFACEACQNPISFSIFDLDNGKGELVCSDCSLAYDFSDDTLKRQLKKFTDLCRQIQQSEEILSQTSIGIYVGDQEIKVPFKILLTRLNSTLDLKIGNTPLAINFRIEPSKDTH